MGVWGNLRYVCAVALLWAFAPAIGWSAQNLIINGDFEASACSGASPLGQISQSCAAGWFGLSTDLFSAQTGQDCSGEFAPTPGSNQCAGLAFFTFNGQNSGLTVGEIYEEILNGNGAEEGIYGTLSSPLVSGIEYQVSARTYRKQGNWLPAWPPIQSALSLSQIELGFTTNAPVTEQQLNWPAAGNSGAYGSYYTAVGGAPGAPIDSPGAWHTMAGNYTAVGGESYFTFTHGNPNSQYPLDPENVVLMEPLASTPNQWVQGFGSYYLLDDVQVSCTPHFSYSLQVQNGTQLLVLNRLPGAGNVQAYRLKAQRFTATGVLLQTTAFTPWQSVSAPYGSNQLPAQIPLQVLFPDLPMEACTPFQIKITMESYCHSQNDIHSSQSTQFSLNSVSCLDVSMADQTLSCGDDPILQIQNSGTMVASMVFTLSPSSGGAVIAQSAPLQIPAAGTLQVPVSVAFAGQTIPLDAGQDYLLQPIQPGSGSGPMSPILLQTSDPFCGRLDVLPEVPVCGDEMKARLSELAPGGMYRIARLGGSAIDSQSWQPNSSNSTPPIPDIELDLQSVVGPLVVGPDTLIAQFRKLPSPFYEQKSKTFATPQPFCGSLSVDQNALCGDSVHFHFMNQSQRTVTGHFELVHNTMTQVSPPITIGGHQTYQGILQNLFPQSVSMIGDLELRFLADPADGVGSLSLISEAPFQVKSIPTRIDVIHGVLKNNEFHVQAREDIGFRVASDRLADLSEVHWTFEGTEPKSGDERIEHRSFPESTQGGLGKVVSLDVSYASGCVASDQRMIHVVDEGLYIPSAFSPNGDGINDIFAVKGQDIEVVSLRIFNRGGEEVFSARGLEGAGWDGRYRGVPVPLGVYPVVVEWRSIGQPLQVKHAVVTVIQ
jgi:gliding motility-associated-like protein